MLIDDGLDLMMAGDEGRLFAVTPYTGNGTSQDIITRQNLVNGGFVWSKNTGALTPHYIVDNTRGIDKLLNTTSTAAQITSALEVTSFNKGGITVQDTGFNTSSSNYILFSLLERAGFLDVMTYTGDGVNGTAKPHNLGVTPEFMIIKAASSVSDWSVYHSSLVSPNTRLVLNTTAAVSSGANYFNDGPSAEHANAANIYAGINMNAAGVTYIAYLFAEKAGHSKFGSYTGNGTTNTITGIGFAPQAVLIKNTSASASWILAYKDAAGNTYYVNPNTTAIAQSGAMSLDADGFSLLSTAANEINTNGANYIYAPF